MSVTQARRLVAGLLAAAALAGAISACGSSSNSSSGGSGGSSGSSASAANAPATVTLGYAGGENLNGYYAKLLAAAHKAMPNLTIKQVVYPTYDDQLNTMLQQVAAGTIPDVIVWDNSAPVGQYAQQGAIQPLNSLVAQQNINLGVYPSALNKAWTINGKLYGVPSYLQDSGFVFNQGLLARAGITQLPTTMSAVATDAKLVKSKTGKTGLVILDNLYHLTQYVLAFGGGWGDGKTIDSAANVQGLQFLINLFDTGAAATSNQLGATWDGEAVADNHAAMADGGPWYIGFMKATAPKVKYTLEPVPTGTGAAPFVVTYGGAYSITSHAKDPAAAMKLIKFLTSATAENEIITSGTGFVPAMSKYVGVYRSQTPAYANITDQLLANGKTLDYPPQTLQFGNQLVAGFEQIAFRHSGSVSALLEQLQSQFGSSS
jgi:multiple sugar transport system substrate-binding protein